MKEQEKIFFEMCIVCKIEYKIFAKDVANILGGFIPFKRAMYYLKKWSDIGFWNWGVSIGTGWFEVENMPERYRLLYKEVMRTRYGRN